MLENVFNVVLMILAFGLLIFVHELGHFVAAKWAGIRTEAFAIGMGPVALSWRKGIGFRLGSTGPEYERRVRAFLSDQAYEVPKELPIEQAYRIGDKLGLGETEYSLRYLPIGGFVKMLGQEDANPNYVSDDPRSYNMTPIGKRMVVISGGVIMNLIFAAAVFVIAFMLGVRMPAPVVGDVSPSLPAARGVALNAAVAGIDAVGLQPGDRVLTIDGEPATTFSNIEIAAAMSKPGNAITLSVERPGAKEPLIFELQPEKSPATGLLAIGVTPGSSTLLVSAKDDDDGSLARLLERVGLAAQGVKPGMVLISANGEDVASFGQVGQMARNSGGKPLQTHWATLNDKGERSGAVDATLNVAPDMEDYRQRDTGGDAGLVGFSPLVRFQRTSDDSANAGRILPGDVLVRIADVEYPRQSQLMETLQKHRRQDIALIVLRNGERTPITAHVNKDGLLRVEISPADDLLITAQPVQTYARYRADDAAKVENVQTPAGRAGLFTTGGTRIVQVAGKPVSTWTDLRESLLAALPAGGGDASVEVLVEHPLVGSPREKVTLDLNADEVKRLQALRWHLELPGGVFEPIYTVRKGGPLKALSMGFEETRKMVMMTYLTLDRLIRGSVGVEQLRGPVGIVQIGAKVARQGMIYLLFLLGAISVNLAVINFLPLPILDGSLFLYLVYEKFKGRPPSLAFQNVTTIVGAVMLATLLIVVTYNDVLRLFS